MLGRLLRPIRAGEKRLAYNDAAFAMVPEILEVTSPAFQHGEMMPLPYGGPGVGQNISPPLAWTGVPAGTAELVLILEDFSVPMPTPFVHAVAIGIAPDRAGLKEGELSDPALLAVSELALGRSSGRTIEYIGPRPIPGHGPHTYVFQLFALSRTLELAPQFGRSQVVSAMGGSVLARGRLDGTFER